MNMTLLLPWFPIVLAVGVAGRLVGRSRGLGVGLLCALFYIALVQAAVGFRVWQDGWALFGVAAGSLAIVAMGGWSGQMGSVPANQADGSVSTGGGRRDEPISDESQPVFRIRTMVTRFDEWLDEHRDRANPWPEFGEFLRQELHNCVGATHVRPYRLQNDGAELVALSDSGSLSGPERFSAKHGLAGRVLASGRAHVTESETADGSAPPGEAVAWCLPILQGTRRLGLILVGRVELLPEGRREFFQIVESLVSQFWYCLSEILASRAAVQRDPVSGLATRPVFFRAAERALHESFQLDEPVAVAVVALEGLRELNDLGRWEAADALVDEVGRALCAKLRTEDRLGRFDGSRFILLLRRVDADLASLIVGQIAARLSTICGDAERWGSHVQLRCGVSCSGSEKLNLHELVDRALRKNIDARKQGLRVALDRATSVERAHVSA